MVHEKPSWMKSAFYVLWREYSSFFYAFRHMYAIVLEVPACWWDFNHFLLKLMGNWFLQAADVHKCEWMALVLVGELLLIERSKGNLLDFCIRICECQLWMSVAWWGCTLDQSRVLISLCMNMRDDKKSLIEWKYQFTLSRILLNIPYHSSQDKSLNK